MKKACELCERMATVHCESDEASLCWHCDAAVHSANFLVARHSRKLLCHVCQSSTSSSVSGGKVGPAVSLCPQCVNRRICGENSGEDEETAVEMEDNQVVPWSPPPMLATESSTSTSESDGGGGGGGSGEEVNSKKRCRLEISSSNHPPLENDNCSSPCHLTMLKVQKTDSGRVGIFDSAVLERFLGKEAGSGMEATEFSHGRIAIDLNSPITVVDLNSF